MPSWPLSKINRRGDVAATYADDRAVVRLDLDAAGIEFVTEAILARHPEDEFTKQLIALRDQAMLILWARNT